MVTGKVEKTGNGEGTTFCDVIETEWGQFHSDHVQFLSHHTQVRILSNGMFKCGI